MGPTPAGVTIDGCYVGTDVTGTQARGVGTNSPSSWNYGIYVLATNSLVTRCVVGAVASGAVSGGIALSGGGGSTIANNWIGISPSGTNLPLGTGSAGGAPAWSSELYLQHGWGERHRQRPEWCVPLRQHRHHRETSSPPTTLGLYGSGAGVAMQGTLTSATVQGTGSTTRAATVSRPSVEPTAPSAATRSAMPPGTVSPQRGWESPPPLTATP